MKNKFLKIFVTVIALVAMISSGVYASSYPEKFSTSTPSFQLDGTLVGYRTKTLGTDGSTLLTTPQPASQFYTYMTVWTDIKWQNGGAVNQFSPRVSISTMLPATSTWLGCFIQYNASIGDQIRLRGASGGLRSDTATGLWTYY